MSVAETIAINVEGLSGVSAAAAAVGNLSSAMKSMNGAGAGAAAAEVASIRANAAARLSAQNAVQSSILASQKNAHAVELANIKAESAARLAEIKTDAAAQAAAVKANAAAAKAAAKETAAAEKAAKKDAAEDAVPSAGGGGDASAGFLQAASVMVAARTAVRAVTAVGEEVYAAYQKAAAIIESLGMAGGRMALNATAAHDELVGVFEAEGKSAKQSEAIYQQITKQAIATGRSKEILSAEFKRLGAAGFKDDAIPALTKMLGDESALKGEGKAKALEMLLTKVQNQGSLSKATYGAFTKQFGSQDALNKELAKELNRKPSDIAAMLKKGEINSAIAEKAMAKVVENQIGGAAMAKANTVLGLIGRIQMALQELFVLDDKTQAPVKEFLGNVLGELTKFGPALKDAANEVFSAAFGTAFDGLNSKGGKKQMDGIFKAIIKGAKMAAAEIRALKKPVDDLVAALDKMTKKGKDGHSALDNLVKAGGMVAKEKIGEGSDTVKATAAKAAIATGRSTDLTGGSETVQMVRRHVDDTTGAAGSGKILTDGIINALTGGGLSAVQSIKGLMGSSDDSAAAAAGGKGLTPANAPLFMNGGGLPGGGEAQAATVAPSAAGDLTAQGADIGGALDAGMAQGITAGGPAATAAAGAVADSVAAKARASLQTHSPSELFRNIGLNVSEGLALGIQGGVHRAVAATGSLAKGVAVAGGGVHIPLAGGAANSNGGGGAGGGAVTIIVQIVPKPGASAAEQGQDAGEAAEKALRAYMRKRAAGG